MFNCECIFDYYLTCAISAKWCLGRYMYSELTHLLSPGYPRAFRTSRGQGNSRRAGTILKPSSPSFFIYFTAVSSSPLHLLHLLWHTLISLSSSLTLKTIKTFAAFLNFSFPLFITVLRGPEILFGSKQQPGPVLPALLAPKKFMRHILVVIKNVFACIKCFLQSSQIIVSSFTHLFWRGRRVNSEPAELFFEKKTDY